MRGECFYGQQHCEMNEIPDYETIAGLSVHYRKLIRVKSDDNGCTCVLTFDGSDGESCDFKLETCESHGKDPELKQLIVDMAKMVQGRK